MGLRTGYRRAVARPADLQRMGGSVTLRRRTPTDAVSGEECTRRTKADGSTITGQATFVIGGGTRTAANVSLMAEAMARGWWRS
jgi:hypothetical protein